MTNFRSTRMEYSTDIADSFCDYFWKSVNCIWDTGELVVDILLEFVTRSLELAISVVALIIQVLCFFRDLLIESMKTFANAIKGTVNVVGSIDTDDLEDFASACLVVVLWVGAGKVMIEAIDKSKNRYNPMTLFTRFMDLYNEKFKQSAKCDDHEEGTWPTHKHIPRKRKTNSRGRRGSKKR